MIKIPVYVNQLAPHLKSKCVNYYIPNYQLENAHIEETETGSTIISYEPQFALSTPLKPEELLNKITPKKLGYGQTTKKNTKETM